MSGVVESPKLSLNGLPFQAFQRLLIYFLIRKPKAQICDLKIKSSCIWRLWGWTYMLPNVLNFVLINETMGGHNLYMLDIFLHYSPLTVSLSLILSLCVWTIMHICLVLRIRLPFSFCLIKIVFMKTYAK